MKLLHTCIPKASYLSHPLSFSNLGNGIFFLSSLFLCPSISFSQLPFSFLSPFQNKTITCNIMEMKPMFLPSVVVIMLWLPCFKLIYICPLFMHVGYYWKAVEYDHSEHSPSNYTVPLCLILIWMTDISPQACLQGLSDSFGSSNIKCRFI